MKLLSKKEEREKVLYRFAHVARLEAADLFPKRVPFGPGRVGYVEEEVEDWIRNRIALRDQRTGS